MESSKVNLGGLLAKTKFKEEERKTLALIISMFLGVKIGNFYIYSKKNQ